MLLNQLTIPVSDVALSLPFYQGFGLKAIVITEHYARLFEAKSGTTLSLMKTTGEIVNPTVIYFETENVTHTVNDLLSKGYTFYEMPTKKAWLWEEAHLKDRDGNSICIYHAGENRLNPPWKVKDAENIKDWKANVPKFKLLLLDVDGVMTDGGMYYTEQGDQMKKFNAKDGLAIRRMQKQGYRVAFVSSSTNVNIIQNRAETLLVPRVYAGTGKKIEVVDSWLEEWGISYEEVAYIGDDLNDIDVIRKVGISTCPADATQRIKDTVDVVLQKKGGEACVRELVENVLGIEL
ncbi:MAG: HAD-IIIA family hydrolase [Bacteroidia bacterium]